MIQFNLLPDVKKEYIKAKRTKRLIISISTLVGAGSLVIMLLLFGYVQVAQKKSISDLTKDIDAKVAIIKSVEGLDEILTIQNQLNALPGLFESEPKTSRIFGYMTDITPKGVYISKLDVDVVNGTMEISGTASSIASINTFVDTLKFATYTSGETIDGKPFTDVLTDLARNNDQSSYTIKLLFDPILFDNTADVAIVVPVAITTRSVTDQPDISSSNLFNAPIEESPGAQ